MVGEFAATCLQLASLPRVASRRPLWDLKHPEDPDSRLRIEEWIDERNPRVRSQK